MEITELQIFQQKEWLIGFIIISIVGSISRLAYNWKHTPKEVGLKNATLMIFFGLVVCFVGEILLKTFDFQKYRIFLAVSSFLGEDILEKLINNKSSIIDKFFNKTEKQTNNEK